MEGMELALGVRGLGAELGLGIRGGSRGGGGGRRRPMCTSLGASPVAALTELLYALSTRGNLIFQSLLFVAHIGEHEGIVWLTRSTPPLVHGW